MKVIINFVVLFFYFFSFSFLSAQPVKETIVVFETSKGVIKIMLYEETSMHKDNFIKLVNQGFYNGLLFHRTIKNFMIQTGDPKSKGSKPGEPLGTGGPGYTISAEFYPHLYHKKGAVAAARLSDNVNPKRESSGSQFYIVQGRKYTNEQLTALENSNRHIRFTDQQRKDYTSAGGTPELDYSYTVFGQVIDGLNVIDSIADCPTDERNRPLENIIINKAYVLK
jgi:peptidyl-prolyl cis-trans isomerase B (cyclophilin B)